jgi:hypothetical protein
MIKKIIAGVCLVFSSVGFAQQSNASPYSYYGVGDVKFKGTVENRSMGGLGILPDSIHINLQNPATYSSLKLTTYTVSASNTVTKFKTDNANEDANRTTIDYLAVALPFKKLGFAFGLMPYTAVGYRIENSIPASETGDGLSRYRRFTGTGGLNRVFGGASYQITPKFSAGADFRYHFGNIQTKSIVGIPESGVQYPTREINDTDYSGISFNLGVTYQTKINKKWDWVTSATYSPESTLKGTTTRNIATISILSNNNEVVKDEIDQIMDTEDIKMPSRFTIGSGFGQTRKWFAGLEYTFQGSNRLGNRFDNVTIADFESSHKVSLGGYYIPKYFSFTSYLSRVTYRAGFKYEKTGLVINNQSVNDYGVSVGIGLPLSGTIGGSNLNIGVEMGKRGTTSAGLVQENYTTLFISLSLNDKWFSKRRYD